MCVCVCACVRARVCGVVCLGMCACIAQKISAPDHAIIPPTPQNGFTPLVEMPLNFSANFVKPDERIP